MLTDVTEKINQGQITKKNWRQEKFESMTNWLNLNIMKLANTTHSRASKKYLRLETLINGKIKETLINGKIKGKRTGLLKDLCGTINFLRNNTSNNCKNIVESHSWDTKTNPLSKAKTVYLWHTNKRIKKEPWSKYASFKVIWNLKT